MRTTEKGTLAAAALLPRAAARFMERGGGRGSREGFTLLEVITAIFIFFCGIVGILSLFTTALVLHKSSKDRTVSSLALEQVILEVRELIEEEALAKGETSPLKPVVDKPIEGYPGYFYSVKFGDRSAEPGGAVTARIRIQWKSRGRVMGETFETLFRPGPGLKGEVMKLRAESG